MAIGTDTMTVTTGDNSDAALGTLFVSSNVYRNDDWMLHMFCQYIQQTTFQLNIHVVMTNEKNPADVLYLVIGGSGTDGVATSSGRGSDRKGPPEPTANVIRERNAIVRSLMGIALHGSFDTYHNYTNHQLLSRHTNTSNNTSSNTSSKTPFTPICWNGGYSMMQTSCHSTSIVAALQHVKMIHYMTVASQLRKNNSNMMMLLPVFSMTLQELDQTLQNTSFLLPYSATASFADMDVAVSLLLAFLSSSSSMTTTTTNLETGDLLSMYHNTFPVNVQRWMVQMIPTIQQLSTITNVPCPYHPNMIQLMDAIVSLANAKSSSCPIIFFYGTEDTKQVLAQLPVKTSAPRSVGAKQPSKSIPKLSATTEDKTDTTGSISNDAATTAAAGGVNDGGKKKLTKQDKKAAAVAAKAASGGGDTSADAAATGNTKKVEATTAAPASDVYDVTALDLRIGKIIKIWEHESADKLYCEEIDFGNGEIRQIASGLRPFYKDPNELLNQLVLVVYNLKKRTLVGFPSHGMVLCASNADHTAVEIVTPPPNATLGERIVFHGLDQTKVAEPESKVAKKKIFESIAPDLVTNEEGYVQWKTHAAQCSIGPIRAVNGMSNAHVS